MITRYPAVIEFCGFDDTCNIVIDTDRAEVMIQNVSRSRPMLSIILSFTEISTMQLQIENALMKEAVVAQEQSEDDGN